MKKFHIIPKIVYILLLIFGSAVSQNVYAIGERIISLGGGSSWTSVETRIGVTEAGRVRPNPVLTLSSASAAMASGYVAAYGAWGNLYPLVETALDMSVSFDENSPALFRDITGNYRISETSFAGVSGQSLARAGTGAVIFGNGPVVVQPNNRSALFAPGNRIRDFTIEFWLYPLSMENGEVILTWNAYASRASSQNAAASTQRINCYASRNRLTWSFNNFFASVDGLTYKNIEFSGNAPIIPRTWSHHLVRFDAATGIIEYIVDGVSQAIVYATATNRENSEVFTPVIGFNGMFLFGEKFSGLMDEFKIHSVFAGRDVIQKYPSAGGRMETMAIDLGDNSSSVQKIDVTGGRFGGSGSGSGTGGTGAGSVQNEYRENGRFKFSDDSEIVFFIRANNNPWLLNTSQWINFTPGEAVTGLTGRYVQIAADFYPSSDGESSPYIDVVNIVYIPGEPPLPPRNLTAAAMDGAVTLSWRHSLTDNTKGYLVYYSSVRGELFGTGASLGPSPIDVGITNNIVINGLSNGTLYYFAVAAYDNRTGETSYHAGEFSSLVTARPLSGLGR
ncbi:MAG: hypothetical protein FWC21_07080 [Treponema sp.]|nr:hypothetical protein [Treponema sp.]